MTAPMKRFASRSLVAAALALAYLAPAAVVAQTTTTNPITSPLEVEYDGDRLNGLMVLYVTAQQCQENNTAKYKFSAKYTSPVSVFEAWVGKSGTDCSKPENRQKTNNGASAAVCRRVYLAQESTTQLAFEIEPRDLFWTNDTTSTSSASDAGAEDASAGDASAEDATAADASTADAATEDSGTSTSTGTGCDLVSNQVYTVWILPLNTATSEGGNTAYPVVTSAPVLKADFTLFTKRPNPPGGLKAGDGENQVSVTFKIIEGAPQKTAYRAYFDWGTGGDGECGSGALAEGEISPAKSSTITSVNINAGKAELGNLEARGIDIDDKIAISVVTVDPAGSESYLAEPVCAQRVLTDDFLTVCQRDPKCKNGFDSCSLRPGTRDGSMWLLGSVFAGLALAFVIRRRSV